MLISEEKTYFNASYDKASKTCLITKDDSPIPDDYIKDKSLISLELSATLDGKKSLTTLILALPKTPESSSFQFTNVLYTASYDAEKNVVNVNDPIMFKNIKGDVTVTIDQSKYFFTPKIQTYTFTLANDNKK